jgi:transcriptional regulator with XRE-family HTH domain
MEYTHIGQMLKAMRKEKNINQNKLADGLMTRSNLSKVENVLQEINKTTLSLLLYRMGYPAKRFFPHPLSNEEFRAYALRDMFAVAKVKNDKEAMEKYMNEMEAMPIFEEGLYKQILLKSKAALTLLQDATAYPLVMGLLLEAIKVTIPNFNPRTVHVQLLGNDDHEIIVQIAVIQFETGEIDASIDLMMRLAENMRTRICDQLEKARSLTFVLYNLSRFLGQIQRYDEALEVCNEGIKIGEAFIAYGHLAELKFNKAYCLFYLHGLTDEVIHLLHQSYYGFLAQGKVHMAEATKNLSAERFNITFLY